MRAAGRLAAEAHELLRGLLAPGVTTAQLDRAAHDFIVARGGFPRSWATTAFPAHLRFDQRGVAARHPRVSARSRWRHHLDRHRRAAGRLSRRHCAYLVSRHGVRGCRALIEAHRSAASGTPRRYCAKVRGWATTRRRRRRSRRLAATVSCAVTPGMAWDARCMKIRTCRTGDAPGPDRCCAGHDVGR